MNNSPNNNNIIQEEYTLEYTQDQSS